MKLRNGNGSFVLNYFLTCSIDETIMFVCTMEATNQIDFQFHVAISLICYLSYFNYAFKNKMALTHAPFADTRIARAISSMPT